MDAFDDDDGALPRDDPRPEGDCVRLSRADMVLLRRATRERWGVPDKMKTEAILQVGKVLTESESERSRLAAAKVLLDFDRSDQRDEKLDLDRAKHEQATREPTIADDDFVIDLSDEDSDDSEDEPPEDSPHPGDGPAA